MPPLFPKYTIAKHLTQRKSKFLSGQQDHSPITTPTIFVLTHYLHEDFHALPSIYAVNLFLSLCDYLIDRKAFLTG